MRTVSLKLMLLASMCFVVAELSAQKKPLDHDAYDSWQSVQSLSLSNDGKILAYSVNPQEGDGELIVRNLESGSELVIPRGTAFSMPEDASYAVCTIKAPFAQTRQAKIDKKKADQMPKDTLAYINLATLEMTKVGVAKSSYKGFDSAPYIYATQEDTAKDKKGKTNLLIINTMSGAIDTLKDIATVEVSKAGDRIVVTTKEDKKDSLSKSSVVLYDMPSLEGKVLSEGKKSYTAVSFNEKGDKVLFMATDEEKKTHGTPSHSIFLTEEVVLKKATRKAPAVTEIRTSEIIPQNYSGIQEGFVVAANSRPSFSNDAKRILLTLQEREVVKDTTVVDFEAAQLDIWVWNKETVPPMDKVRARSASLSAVINLDQPGTIVTLSANSHDRISYPAGATLDYAVSMDTEEYWLEDMWAQGGRTDVSLVSMADGSRTPLAEAVTGRFSASPYGHYFMWFNTEDGNWYSFNIEDKEFVNITGQTGVAFWDEDDDHPMDKTPVSTPRWVGENDYVLIADKYDVWKFSLDGKKAINLTAGEGRKNQVQYAPVELVRETNPFLYQNIKTFPKKGKIYLTAFDEKTSKNGMATIDIAKASAPQGFLAEYSYSGQVKAADSETIVYVKGNFQNPMDVHVTKDDWKTETKLSDINPQQADYIWGDVQLVHWDAYDGTPLKGLFFTPENLDPAKKYPMMIYFYEKNAETLYNYRTPAPSASTVNIPFFVSRGYVVFVPDIVYKDGHPGESAYNCICAGAEAMCSQFSFIDKSKMAIQGQSWGGYQTAYLVTRTNMFAAAGAGAPVGNMTSAYGGIRWESGSSRIPQYEYGQSRIGKTLWEDGGLDLYIENSPVFFAPNVQTPVLIMHNDNDGAVPWYQGIEFFMSLRRLGKPAWLLQYNNEAHNLMERRNRKDLSIRLSQFFDHYLKGEPVPVWMESGIPHYRKGNYFGYEIAE
ncbi:MAG: prolyl oligopeptidase family serine peptidase [Bacteroidales bacterium]|nr:prolyl oligopeptidase family serine peptidase [Bacteroidales bacterium]